MTRISLGISTAVVLWGVALSAAAQTPPTSTPPATEAPAAQTAAPSAMPVVPPTEAPAAAATAPSEAPAAAATAPSEAPATAQGRENSAGQGTPVTDPVTSPAAEPAPATPAEVPAAGAAPAAAEIPPAAEAAASTANVESAEAAAQPALASGATEAVAAPPALPSAHDLSPMGMYNQADLVVKSVLLALLAASFLCWTVLFYKLVETAVARRRARHAARILTAAQSLKEATQALEGRRDPGAFMAHAVSEEFRRSAAAVEPAGAEGVKERAVSLVNRVEVQAAARLKRGMGLLATIGSVAPFVGLFGTVWGIMNSFIGIAESQTTNLAVVAPGIAEALFATAIGLVAAIPAVVIYNHFTRVIQGYKQTLGDAGAATLRLLSRDIDFRHLEG